MSDEEREALRNFKSEYETCNHNSSDLIIELDDAKIILNLIEKQQKEIEELKEELDRQINVRMINEEYLEKNFISKEKIKEKVEEIKKYKDLARDSIEERIVIADSDSLNYGRKEAHEKDIKVLCSLLEKE